MRESLERLCRDFTDNRMVLKRAFRFESNYLYPVCANVFCARNASADAEALADCKQVLKQKTGVFSNFRGNLTMPICSMLASGRSTENLVEQALENYRELKKHFWPSQYLALSAFLLADMGVGGRAQEQIARGRRLYDRMKKEHPFLTSAEDCVFAVLMAFSEQTDDALVADMERCYKLVKERFSDSNCAQSVSHVLALSPGSPEKKTARLFQLYDGIRAAGGKYGKHRQLATLAAVSVLEGEAHQVVRDILEVDDYLAGQKGFGFWSMDRKDRMMYAAMLVSDDYCAQNEALSMVYSANAAESAARTASQNAVMTSTLAMLAAQQAAMCAMITSSAAASSAAASAH